MVRVFGMTDDAARIEQLEAELAAARERETALLGELAEARDQQEATAEILRVIASAPAGLEGVTGAAAETARRLTSTPRNLDGILAMLSETARRLCGADAAG